MSLADRRYATSRCTKCHSCKQTPVVESKDFSTICPSYDFGVFHSYSAAGKLALSYGLEEGRVEYNDELRRNVYACTMCGACQSSCTWNHDHVDPLDTLYALRERMVADGQSPSEHAAIVRSLKAHGNPDGLPRSDRMAWASDLALRDARSQAAQVLLHAGAAFAYGAPQELKAIVALLEAAQVDFAVMLADEPEFGGAAFDLGYAEVARDLGEQALAAVEASGAKSLVVCGADTLSTIRAIHPRLGLPEPAIPCLHISEFLEDLVREGRLQLNSRPDLRLAYHDACKLGRLSEGFKPWHGEIKRVSNVIDYYDPPAQVRNGAGGVYDAPRFLLQAAGIDVIEFERRRELSYCCGGAGGGKQAVPGFGDGAGRSRRAEAIAAGVGTIATGCALCISHIEGIADGQSVRTTGIYSLLASALTPAGA